MSEKKANKGVKATSKSSSASKKVETKKVVKATANTVKSAAAKTKAAKPRATAPAAAKATVTKAKASTKEATPKKATPAASKTGLEGKKAPAFALTDHSGKKISLSAIKSKFVVVYFYPKDDTPGCTVETQGFQKLLPSFEKASATVIGISGGNDKTKAKFCQKYDLTLTLLSDTDGAVGTSYGAYGEKSFMGRKTVGFLRKSFVLDQSRKIIKEYDQVKVNTHPQEVLEFLQGV